MTPARLRLLSLVALAIPVALTAVAVPVSPGLPALALATAAAGAALLLAGPLFRLIIAVLIALLGGVTLAVAAFTPVTPDLGGFAVAAIAGGILQLLIGIGIALTARAWPASASRYSRTRTAGDSASDWDALSAGDDPTDVR